MGRPLQIIPCNSLEIAFLGPSRKSEGILLCREMSQQLKALTTLPEEELIIPALGNSLCSPWLPAHMWHTQTRAFLYFLAFSTVQNHIKQSLQNI